jgi:hypothetical protein
MQQLGDMNGSLEAISSIEDADPSISIATLSTRFHSPFFFFGLLKFLLLERKNKTKDLQAQFSSNRTASILKG